MAAVYRARHSTLNRWVALKLLPPEAATDPTFAERFRIEACALVQLDHPNVVSVHDSGQTADGHLFIVMEYVPGGDLATLLASGPVPVARALAIAHAVCSALNYAHTRGIIHRDIKPANVLLGDEGEVKVADFGLARLRTDANTAASGLTVDGTALGTPAYMAPEQRAGRPVDARSDLYSLGVMLYELLTGDLPQGAWRPPSHKVNSAPLLDSLVAQALQIDPAERVTSAAEFLARLERLSAVPSPSSRRRWMLVGSMAGMAGVTSIGWQWQRSSHDSPPTTPPPVPVGPALWPPSPPATYRPLATLDLKTSAMTGFWHWVDNAPGGTLAIEYTHEKPSFKILHLPVHPDSQSYDLRVDLWLEHRGSNLMIIFPAGQARPALVLDLYDHSGLELIRLADWKTNETTVAGLLPTGRFLPLAIRVRPKDDRVAITVEIEDRPFLQWEGEQKDLSLPNNEYPPGLVNQRGPGLSLASLYGAARLRAMEVTIHP